MLGFEYGGIFRVNADIQISFILVSSVCNFILELMEFTKKLTLDIEENSNSHYKISKSCYLCPERDVGRGCPLWLI